MRPTKAEAASDAAFREHVAIIPEPLSVERRDGEFLLGPGCLIHADAALEGVAQALATDLNARHRLGARTAATSGGDDSVAIRVDEGLMAPLGEEGYELSIGPERLVIGAARPAGAYWATRSLLQLADSAPRRNDGALVLPALLVRDKPRFGWRGMMVDVSRHFFPASELQRLVDLLSYHKLNSLHLHLTDDQGWRMPVAKYPLLTELGSRRSQSVLGHAAWRPRRWDATPVEGSYTREELLDLVRHAATRFVNLVPEIDMPGHAQAAIAAYPELGPGPRLPVLEDWGVNHNVFNADEKTLAFLEDVLDEVMDIFPSAHVHIGGDEVPRRQWRESASERERMAARGLADADRLQSYIVGRLAAKVAARGRKAVGWDEVSEGGLPKGITVMGWRGEKPGAKAALQGRDVVMAPTTYTYFDYRESTSRLEPISIGQHLPLRKVYGWEPVPPRLRGRPEATRVLGGQAQLWSEYLKRYDALEYAGFPRGAALAEALWSQPGSRGWKAFSRRLARHLPRLALSGTAFRFTAKASLLGRYRLTSRGSARFALDPGQAEARSLQVLVSGRGRGEARIIGARLLDASGAVLATQLSKGWASGRFSQSSVYTFHLGQAELGKAAAVEVELEPVARAPGQAVAPAKGVVWLRTM